MLPSLFRMKTILRAANQTNVTPTYDETQLATKLGTLINFNNRAKVTKSHSQPIPDRNVNLKNTFIRDNPLATYMHYSESSKGTGLALTMHNQLRQSRSSEHQITFIATCRQLQAHDIVGKYRHAPYSRAKDAFMKSEGVLSTIVSDSLCFELAITLKPDSIILLNTELTKTSCGVTYNLNSSEL